MKRIHWTYGVIILCLAAETGLAQARPEGGSGWIGFVDENKDGINDRFADGDGNGVNDMTGGSYAHAFRFQDADGDGLNDLWRDADGDGVNDLLGEFNRSQRRWVDHDGDGILDEEVGGLRGRALKAHVLDMNADGKNDVTGEKYTGRDLRGYRYGRVDEENSIVDSNFVDADGDGMNDRFVERVHGQARRQQMDLFIDADGDGIADNRGLGKQLGIGKGKQKGKQ